MKEDKDYMKLAVDLALEGVSGDHGGPFGAIIVDRDGNIVGKGYNRVTSTNDPTAHAEVVAIRDACKNLEKFQLDGCTIFTSCEPCPMCLGAIYWARPDRIVYGCDKVDAASIGFDDDFIYKEIVLDHKDRSIRTEQVDRESSLRAFQYWESKQDKIEY